MLLLAHTVLAQDIPFERYELSNGLQVVLMVDHALPQVVVDVWYRVGSKDEQPGRSGFAHLFEHLMFMGTDRLPGSGIDMTMEANGGWNNAWTMEDATNYYDVGPPNLLQTLLWIEADRMEALGKAMTQEKLDLQRDVVRNERRQSYEDRPYGIGWIEVPELMYPKGHPYAHTVIGSHEDLTAATLQDVKDFFATWYVPNNASLVVAGDFDPAVVKPVIQQYFGHIAQKPLPERFAAPLQNAPQKARVELKDQVQYPQVNWFFHTPGAYLDGDAEVRMLGSLLASGESSRLYRRLVLGGLAQEVSAEQMPTQHGSVFMISATAAEGVGVPALEQALKEELAALAAAPPSPEEMERLKNQFEYAFLSGLEPLRERAELLNRYWAYTGTPDHLAKNLARVRGVTADGLRSAASTWLQPGLAGAIVIVPEEAK